MVLVITFFFVWKSRQKDITKTSALSKELHEHKTKENMRLENLTDNLNIRLFVLPISRFDFECNSCKRSNKLGISIFFYFLIVVIVRFILLRYYLKCQRRIKSNRMCMKRGDIAMKYNEKSFKLEEIRNCNFIFNREQT